ncbi:prepilin-type N-terminal cleavage/methylation domain-containing protein [Hyphomonas sp.]|uniref:prepilin-type N-terminal cleavage/methylation domain-containing protein n=1 Tax=Hyphomonas sp. TaxID=87 RepID=UPI00356949E5
MPRNPNDHGYSLIEVLVALAIVGVLSTIIFRSLGLQAQQVERVQDATAAAMELVADHRLLETTLAQTLPAWPEQAGDVFTGNELKISGITTGRVFSDLGDIQNYSLQLTEADTEHVDLTLTTLEGSWTLIQLPRDAAFSYYGYDGLWRASWPPPPLTAFETLDVETHFRNGPLPAMIRLTSTSKDPDGNWIVAFSNSEPLPLRANDLIGGEGSVF